MTQTVVRPPADSSSSPEGSAPRVEGGLAPTGPVVRLNAFQVLMRRWSKFHAYNAGQVMRVSGAGDRERWKRAVEAVVHELGLGRARFTAGDLQVQFVPVEEVPIEQSAHDLQTFFNEELNRPFVGGDLPIRFCMLPAPRVEGSGGAGGNGDESHYLAAVYDHWIGDSRAMRELMHRILERYQHPDRVTGNLPPLTLEAPGFTKLYRKHVGRLTRLAAMRESLKNIWDHRRAFRLNLWDPLDFTSRFIYRELPEGLIERLYKFAKARGASVNDLFIGVIGQSIGMYTAPERLGKKRKLLHFARRQIGIGTIVDIREAAAQNLDRVFNLYLSSYTVLLDNPEQRTVDDLSREIAAKTSRMKKSMATVRRFWALVMARFWYDAYDSTRFRATLLHKTVPVAAGISNVNMTNSWADDKGKEAAPAEEGTPRILDYLRISPTGPLIPLVFTLTTIRRRLSLCVTYRVQSFHEPNLLTVVDDFVRRLEAVGT